MIRQNYLPRTYLTKEKENGENRGGHQKRAGRRSFLKKGIAAAGAATVGAGLFVNGNPALAEEIGCQAHTPRMCYWYPRLVSRLATGQFFALQCQRNRPANLPGVCSNHDNDGAARFDTSRKARRFRRPYASAAIQLGIFAPLGSHHQTILVGRSATIPRMTSTTSEPESAL
jgi:hypothetical protein